MTELLELVARGVVIGVAGSAAMDLWSLFLRRAFGIPTLDYAMLGRWIGHMPKGRFVHDKIAASAPVLFERPLGWAAHYGIGIAFGVLLLVIVGLDWAHDPTLGPPLALGLATIVAPWFVMQPDMGAGIAGSRTPNPRATRRRNLATHTVYGLGMFAAALVIA